MKPPDPRRRKYVLFFKLIKLYRYRKWLYLSIYIFLGSLPPTPPPPPPACMTYVKKVAQKISI